MHLDGGTMMGWVILSVLAIAIGAAVGRSVGAIVGLVLSATFLPLWLIGAAIFYVPPKQYCNGMSNHFDEKKCDQYVQEHGFPEDFN